MKAVVIGGGIAGLVCARALSDHAEHVYLLERDITPTEASPRKGVPQGSQAHLLLEAGRKVVAEMFPGLFDDLNAAGAQAIDLGRDSHWHHNGAFRAECELGFTTYLQTRPLLEDHLRRRVLALNNVELRAQTQVAGLEITAGQVTGVRVQSDGNGSHRPDGASRESETSRIEAAIVIDASGRSSRAVTWLKAAGYQAPLETEVPVRLGYASLIASLPADALPERPATLVYGRRPDYRRHGILFKVEDNRWLFGVMGYWDDHPPPDLPGFAAYLASLAHPSLAEAFARAEPLTKVRVFKFPKQVRRHFERAPLPAGLGIVGDAACILDPVFGQGMSVACLQAQALAKQLAAGAFDSQAFARDCARTSSQAWLMATIEAYRYPGAGKRPRGIGVLHRLMDRVIDTCSLDPKVCRAFFRVVHLEQGLLHLARPDLLWHIVRPR